MNLIVDINNAFYKSYFVYTNIYGKDEPIKEKVLFNKFMADFFYSCRLFSDNNKIERIICCYDSTTSFRKLMCPKYKSNRTKKEDSFYNVLNHSMKWFEEHGFIVTQIDNLEADDCIGLWVRHLAELDKCILSADEDVRQLLNQTTCIYNNNSKDKRFYFFDNAGSAIVMDIEDYKTFYPDPNFVLFSKMILGCEGDVVPKLLKGRIGEKTLEKKVFKKIAFNKDYIEDNDLVEICMKLNQAFKDEQILIRELDINLSLVNLCSDKYYPVQSSIDFIKGEANKLFTYNGNYTYDSITNQ